MLRITADLFSGRPNPAWEIEDEAEVRAALRALTADPSLLTEDAPATSGLGLQGFRLEVRTDELAQDFGVGAPVYLPVGSQARGPRAAELAERVINVAARGVDSTIEGLRP
jgi:hypothetical protein